jgi:hypothetical protein
LRQESCAFLVAQFNVRANRETTGRPMTNIVEFREHDFLIQKSIILERRPREFIEKNRLAAWCNDPKLGDYCICERALEGGNGSVEGGR